MINMNSDLFSGGTSTGATATVYEEISEEIYEGPPDFSAAKAVDVKIKSEVE